jgi:prepilin-type N-terminal cleavage/methylation domain-containing protein/prepilin-type processing-associated H-X9-DG protein
MELPKGQRVRPGPRGFTLLELLVVIAIIAVLIAILQPSLSGARQQAQLIICASNIRQLDLANPLYAGDNNTFSVIAAADIFNDLGDGEGGHFRWHGTRDAAGQPFDPARGPLAPYLGPGGQVKSCPTFNPLAGASSGNNFEQGCGGYGYNELYVGGRDDLYGFCPQAAATSAPLASIASPTATVMFTDAGMAQPAGPKAVVTEYSFCEAPFLQEAPGLPSTDPAWPSIHFRHHGRANVAWADGHVTVETLAFSNESYGLTPVQVQAAGVGWFGPHANTMFQITK